MVDFYFDKGYKDKHRNECKVCAVKLSCERQKRNSERVRQKNKNWIKNNVDKVKQWKLSYSRRGNELRRIRYKSNPDFRQSAITQSKVYRSNPNNKLKIRKSAAIRRKRYFKNPLWRLKLNMRRRLLHVLHGNRKSDTTLKLVGCTWQQLREHLEKQFINDMSWDNYGFYGWHVDHIKPCESFDLSIPEEQQKCFHYTNLQPLWARDNLVKGFKQITV